MIPRTLQPLCARSWVLALTWLALGHRGAEGLEIVFDFSADTSGFFAEGTEGRRILESAAAHYEVLLQDRLGELVAAGNNSLTVSYIHPSTLALVTVAPPAIPADTILVYVGAANLSGSQIGLGYRGGINPRGTISWLDYVDTRGQSGIVYGGGANEVAPWGGSMIVDTRDAAGALRQWDYSLGVRPVAAGLHLYSLLIHELAHVLGFGTCDAWWGRVDGAGRFAGPRAVSVYGGRIPLDTTGTHWTNGTESRVYGRGNLQETAMGPLLATEAVNYATELDLAALRDLGWQVADPLAVPEPPTLAMAMSPGGGSAMLTWEGEARYRYTVLATLDYARWRATGPSLSGVVGPMQTVLPAGGNAIAYRLLLENRVSPVSQAQALAVMGAEAAGEEIDGEGILSSRNRPGGTAHLHGADASRIGEFQGWCGSCAGGDHAPPAGMLRREWVRRLGRPIVRE